MKSDGARPGPLVPALLAVGGASLIWQVAAARAVMAGLRGNELTLGLVLACWLVLMGLSTALAAAVGRRWAPAVSSVPALLLLAPAALLASLALQQATLPALTADLAGPGRALTSSLACLAPPCLVLGGAFGLLSLQAPPGTEPARWAARVYFWESLGTVAAGLLFHLLLARAPLELIALVAGLLPWLAALPLAWRGGRRGALLVPAAAGVLALLVLVPGLELPGSGWLAPRVPGYRVLELRNSRHAALAALARGDQRLFLANGQRVFTNQDRLEAERLVHLTLLCHSHPRRVLMIGGGLGGGLEEALKHPISHLDYVELDPELVDMARRWSGLPRDPRLTILIGDGRRLLARRRGAYDVILVTLPAPSSALVNRFYTEEMFSAGHAALRPGGLLRLALPSAGAYLSDPQARLHATVLAGLQRAFGNVTVLPGAETLVLARRGGALNPRFAELAGRLRQRKLRTEALGQAELMQRTLPLTRDLYRQRLEGVRPLHNSDLHPAAYFHSALLWLEITSRPLGRALERLGDLLAAHRWAAMLAPGLLVLAWVLVRRRRAPGLAIGLAGLTGMALEVSLLLACQALRGVVYHELGALLTAFMAGLSGGALLGRRLVARWPGGALRLALLGCAAAASAAVAAMQLAARWPGASLPLLLLGQALAGLAVGACYAPAAAALAPRHGAGGATARSYAWDMVGAAAGALLATALTLPLLGLAESCWICALLCLAGAAGLRQAGA
jgi:spermidine synthase